MKDYFIIVYKDRIDCKDTTKPEIKRYEHIFDSDKCIKRIDELLNDSELFTIYSANCIIDRS